MTPADTGALAASQHVVRIGLFLFAAIAIVGGSLQMFLGQPDTSPRLDNVHRFMAGIYLGTGLICLWAGLTIRTPALQPMLEPTERLHIGRHAAYLHCAGGILESKAGAALLGKTGRSITTATGRPC